MIHLWRLSAAQLTEGYLKQEFTPLEALEACFLRAAECEPVLNAMVHLDYAGARLAAEASWARWADGIPASPLDGVPISLKDNLHAAGQPTGWGSRLLDGFIAPNDELPVARLRAAGVVLFGKTTLPEFAMEGTTVNAATGVTCNPWNPALTPGGSSGGAVAAVAAGYGPLALGTDGGGSTRRPASHCGLFGFKPSAGTVPRAGGVPEIFLDHEVVGTIGRTLQDVRVLTGVLAEADMSADRAGTARILYVPQFGAHPVDVDIARQVREAARRFEDLGYQVEEASHFDLAEPINSLWSSLSASGLAWMLNNAADWPEFGLERGQIVDVSLCGEVARANRQHGEAAKAAVLFELLFEIQTLKRRLGELFAKHDFILLPATAALPWPAAESHPTTIAGQSVGLRGHAVFTAFANAAGLPAIAVPSGWVRGLPTGFQVVGKPGSDSEVLAMADHYDQVYPWSIIWPKP
jgi:aspartyl-tRNA(Asn)/glutamyl-tRNA(Gln) amidotransferase subunit A